MSRLRELSKLEGQLVSCATPLNRARSRESDVKEGNGAPLENHASSPHRGDGGSGSTTVKNGRGVTVLHLNNSQTAGNAPHRIWAFSPAPHHRYPSKKR